MNHRRTKKKIKELEREIMTLSQTIDSTTQINEILQKNYDEMDKERINYRRIIKYHSVLLVLMNLLSDASGHTDIGGIVKRNIQEYYRAENNDLMEIPNNDRELKNEEYIKDQDFDSWDTEEEFQ